MVIEWATGVRIRVFDLPPTVEALHRRAFVNVTAWRSLPLIIAYVRHHHSNYHNLLAHLQRCREARADGALQAYDIVHERVNAKIESVLDRRYGEAWRQYRGTKERA